MRSEKKTAKNRLLDTFSFATLTDSVLIQSNICFNAKHYPFRCSICVIILNIYESELCGSPTKGHGTKGHRTKGHKTTGHWEKKATGQKATERNVNIALMEGSMC